MNKETAQKSLSNEQFAKEISFETNENHQNQGKNEGVLVNSKPPSVDFEEKSPDFIALEDEFVKNGDFPNENMQISSIFSDEISNISSFEDTTLDGVSAFDIKTSSKNEAFNLDFSVSENEKADFGRLFPGVSMEKLQKDNNFILFTRNKGKKRSFCEIYSDYVLLRRKIIDDYNIRAKAAENNKAASPGALRDQIANNCAYFTKEQVKRMSKEQIAKNYQSIRESQQKW